MESHVEMDGAFALYEAWIKVLTGEADIALAYGFGKSSAGDLRRVLALQLDPYVMAPLWPDSVSIAALQARLGLDKGLWTERGMAEVAARSRAAAISNSQGPACRLGQRRRTARRAVHCRSAARARLRADHRRRRCRHHRCRRPGPRTVRAAGLDHRLRAPHRFRLVRGTRPDHVAVGGRRRRWRLAATGTASMSLSCTRRSRIRRSCCARPRPARLSRGSARPAARWPGNPMFAAGLARIGHAARQIISGAAGRALGHATSGPALQQNLVCMMEAR